MNEDGKLSESRQKEIEDKLEALARGGVYDKLRDATELYRNMKKLKHDTR